MGKPAVRGRNRLQSSLFGSGRKARPGSESVGEFPCWYDTFFLDSADDVCFLLCFAIVFFTHMTQWLRISTKTQAEQHASLPHDPSPEQQRASSSWEVMKRSLLLLLPSRRCLGSLLFSLLLLFPLGAAWATNEVTLTFENTDIRTVIKKVGELSRTTFLFDPEQVQGKITLLAPQKVSPEEALRLLQSALALHGYRMVKKEEGAWILPVEKAVQTETIIEVVPLKYAKAEEVAYTLSCIAPPGVHIAPYSPTNSLIISGDPEAVAELIGVLKEKKEESGGE